MKKTFLFFAAVLAFSTSSLAKDIQISADERVEWHQKAQKMVAIGNAVASKNDMTIKANNLTGYYTGKTAENKGQISRMTANGNVRMSSAQAKAFGDNLDYNLAQDQATLLGKPAKIDTGTETITAEDSITYYPSKQRAIALGNVIGLDKDGNKIYADKMIADFVKTSQKQSNLILDKVNIYGHIKIVTKDATVTADKGVYLPQSGLVKLFDNVVINQQGNILRGDKAETNLHTGISKLLSASNNRVKGVFKEKK